MGTDPAPKRRTLRFQLTKKDLYDIVRIKASRRPFRKVAIPALAGFVLLGHSLEGHYLTGLLWGGGVAALYWAISHLMFLLHVYGSPNASFLVPQEISLLPDRMIVTSEHSTEEFPRPEPARVKTREAFLIVDLNRTNLVFLKRSFEEPEDFETLKTWLENT